MTWNSSPRHTPFENPLPEVLITAADLISLLAGAKLLFYGITVDDDFRPLAPLDQPGDSVGEIAAAWLAQPPHGDLL